MKSPRRISFGLLDDDLKQMIEAKTKIFPVTYSYVVENINPNQYEYVRVTDTNHRNEIYVWNNKFELIGADDYQVLWSDVLQKPELFPPTPHTHTEVEVIGINKYTREETDNLLSKKADTTHNHDTVYVKYDGSKTLTTNDFTNAYKTKLESLSDKASLDYTTMNADLTNHKNDSTVHVTSTEKSKIALIDSKADTSYVNTELSKKVATSTFTGHTGNLSVHVTQSDKDLWNNNLDKSYVFEQLVPNVKWTIMHNLNKYPSVTIIDESGGVIIGRYSYVDANTLEIILSDSSSGKVILN